MVIPTTVRLFVYEIHFENCSNLRSFSKRFVVLCDNIFKEQAYQSLDEISTDLLPKLFSLRNDPVANIRVCLARVITSYLLNLGRKQHKFSICKQHQLFKIVIFVLFCQNTTPKDRIRSVTSSTSR